MPKMSVEKETGSTGVFSQDLLTFSKKGEAARIVLLDEDATYVYRHYIQTPAGPRGGVYAKCLGDYDLLNDGAMKDGDRCPACRFGQSGNNVPVSLPVPYFALYVAKYNTSDDGNVITPIAMSKKVWKISGTKRRILRSLREEHGDLRRKDLILRCEVPEYHKLDIMPSSRCAAFSDENAKQQYMALIKEVGSYPDDYLEPLLANDMSYSDIEEAVQNAGVDVPDASSRVAAGVSNFDDIPDNFGEDNAAPPWESDGAVNDVINSSVLDAELEAMLNPES